MGGARHNVCLTGAAERTSCWEAKGSEERTASIGGNQSGRKWGQEEPQMNPYVTAKRSETSVRESALSDPHDHVENGCRQAA